MIKVTSEVLEGLKAVRDSGAYNMFDRINVMNWLYNNDYKAACSWVMGNKHEYARGIFEGFESKEFYTCPYHQKQVPNGVSCPDCMEYFNNNVISQMTLEQLLKEYDAYFSDDATLTVDFGVLEERLSQMVGRHRIYTFELVPANTLKLRDQIIEYWNKTHKE